MRGRQRCKLLVRQDRQTHLQREVGSDRKDVGVPAPLADPVDRSLNVDGAVLDADERIGDRAFGVVVEMNADRRG